MKNYFMPSIKVMNANVSGTVMASFTKTLDDEAAGNAPFL
jgi:hypothetical protein